MEPMRSAIARVVGRLRSEESGQSLIIVSLTMVVVLGSSGMALDVATWYQKHHLVQIATDAAALAAANCLANSGSGSTCSSSTDVADAEQVAINYAAQNGLTITTSNVTVNTSKGTVQVTASQTAPAIFANLLGISSSTQSAGSTASWASGGSTPCSSASSTTDCSAIYSGNTGCAAGDGFTSGSSSDGGTVEVSGTIHSEGLLTFANNGSLGADGSGPPPALTVAGSCYTDSVLPSKNGYTATQVASETWPVNYAASPYFIACSGATCTTSSSTNGVTGSPTYCTQATTSSSGFTFTDINGNNQLPVTGNVYCAIGTGTASNPATWNGTITVEATDCGSPAKKVTFIGGNVSFSNGSSGGTDICYQPDLYNCLVYSTANVADTNSTFSWTGDIFAPDGSVELGSSASGIDASSTSGMLEALNVNLQNGTLVMTGDGPVVSGSGGGGPIGTDALIQ
jgi:Flp pilus assembly protein TadG